MLDKLNKNWLIGIVIVLVVIFLLFFNHKDNLFGDTDDMIVIKNNDHDSQEPVTEQNNSIDSNIVIVDIKGEVKSPGVYEVNDDVRIHEVINLAGGFTGQADEDVINLAQKVHDEMVIFIPAKGENNVQPFQTSSQTSKIRINYATQDEIEQLNGIGPSKARAIIDYREEHGSFQSVEDLLNVSGIGEKTLENIQDDIQIP